MPLTVAIVGRPNVGKSTLFNRLCGLKLAIVDSTPGVTRDRRYGEASLSDLKFTVIDTAGFDEPNMRNFERSMQDQTARAVKESDIILFLVDLHVGLMPQDYYFASLLRRESCPIILAANKCDGKLAKNNFFETYELGLGEPIQISAEHGEGMADLYHLLRPLVDAKGAKQEHSIADSKNFSNELKVAIIGRPNVGKSTLLNSILREDRAVSGPEAGLTRDTITGVCEWGDRQIKFFDTAGMRRRARIQEKLEKLSVKDTLRAIRFAEVVILVFDTEALGDRQDFVIAKHVAEEGRALVLAVNKWDLVKNKADEMHQLKKRIKRSLPQLKGVSVTPISAITGFGIDDVMQAVFAIHSVWNVRVATGPLNRWFEQMLEEHPPPLVKGRRLRLRYITQVTARPPSFVIFTTRPGSLPESYRRYLVNGLRDRFNLLGVPIRLMLRSGINPYKSN